MIRVGDKGNFIDLPKGRNKALDVDVHAGEVKVVISPTGVFDSEKMVGLRAKRYRPFK